MVWAQRACGVTQSFLIWFRFYDAYKHLLRTVTIISHLSDSLATVEERLAPRADDKARWTKSMSGEPKDRRAEASLGPSRMLLVPISTLTLEKEGGRTVHTVALAARTRARNTTMLRCHTDCIRAEMVKHYARRRCPLRTSPSRAPRHSSRALRRSRREDAHTGNKHKSIIQLARGEAQATF